MCSPAGPTPCSCLALMCCILCSIAGRERACSLLAFDRRVGKAPRTPSALHGSEALVPFAPRRAADNSERRSTDKPLVQLGRRRRYTLTRHIVFDNTRALGAPLTHCVGRLADSVRPLPPALNTTRLSSPFRSWCPACVTGRATGQASRRRAVREEKRI